MKAIRGIFNLVSYWILIIIGLAILLGFITLGLWAGAAGTEFTYNLIEYINNILFNLGLEDMQINPDSVPENLNWMIASIFFVMSLPGLVILLLTQRTATINKQHKTRNKKMVKAYKKDKQE